eukprot:scaffold11875_cov132-Isochrysis_galbana.AAC.8
MLPTQNADTDMLIDDVEERAALAKCQSQCATCQQCPFVRKARRRAFLALLTAHRSQVAKLPLRRR